MKRHWKFVQDGESSLAKVFKREYEANCRFAGVIGAEGRLNVVQWEHKLLFGGTISNSGDGRENVTCTFKVKLC